MRAAAYVVAPEAGAGAPLRQLAQRVGFESVHAFRDIAEVEQRLRLSPLAYFLFAAGGDGAGLAAICGEIRQSGNKDIRFSPMICFAENPSMDAIRAYVQLGFDDVIARPFTLSRVAGRLGRQVDCRLVYYETPTYFGPDRRDRTPGDAVPSGRGSGGPHRRFEIMRRWSGIEVLDADAQLMI